ncbi:SGNH/GDSL hydrolase family protein [Nocardiopsis sp. CNS-639]|uniref:SGNH/GDSL hydrolase family protein n=1 Tax=Nocardiopsis sp. CNS-639 TaxID=1169153 RepID=UPI0004777721|nr:SGNH/GDSL hydrolase family protein [Nocardiopsis sp. CNS-639]
MRRHPALSLSALLTLPTALVLLAAPAHAAPTEDSSTTQYVAMGDSFSAGLGAPNADLDCGRSPQGYPALWAQAQGITEFTDVTCGGAVAGDVLDNQVQALSPDTDVVTITIGGNDIDLGGLVLTCLGGNQACSQKIEEFKAEQPTHMANVSAAYDAIKQEAPNAQVYVLGYPRLFETTFTCFDLISPSKTQRTLLNEAADLLNDNLAVEAQEAGFEFVDVRPQFNGHGRCSITPWIHPIASLPAPLHPNTDGYRLGYFAALNEATG